MSHGISYAVMVLVEQFYTIGVLLGHVPDFITNDPRRIVQFLEEWTCGSLRNAPGRGRGGEEEYGKGQQFHSDVSGSNIDPP